MSSRDAILGRIRANKPAPVALPEVPLFDGGQRDGQRDGLLGCFAEALKSMGGLWLEPGANDPLGPVRDRIADAAVVVSTVPEIKGTRDIAGAEPASLADVDVAVVRAAFGIAETGSVAFTEQELGVNTLAYLAQHIIVLLDPADVLVNLHHAYLRPEFRAARYTVFHTGPSATADIEGVLIRGAQGVRSLSVLILARDPKSGGPPTRLA